MIFGLVYACPGVNKSGWGIVLPHNRRKLLRSQFGQFLLRLLPQFRNRHRIKDSRGKKGSGNPEADDAVADRIDDAPVRRAEGSPDGRPRTRRAGRDEAKRKDAAIKNAQRSIDIWLRAATGATASKYEWP